MSTNRSNVVWREYAVRVERHEIFWIGNLLSVGVDLEKRLPVAVELPDALSRHGDVAVEVHRFVRGM